MSKKIVYIMLFLICNNVFAADLIRYVNTDSTAGGNGTENVTTGDNRAYPTQFAAEAALQQDLTDSGGDTMTIECYAPSSVADTTAVHYAEWTTGASNWLKIKSTDGKYKMSITNTSAIIISENYVTLEGLDIDLNYTANVAASGVLISSVDAGNSILIDKCIIDGNCSSTGGVQGIYLNNANINLTISNTIIKDIAYSTDNDFYGIRAAGFVTCNVFNSILCGNRRGISNFDANSVVVTNCAIFNSTLGNYDLYGNFTLTYSAGDDSEFDSGTGNIGWDSEATDWAAAFYDYANGDFSLKAGSDLIDAGTDLSGSGITTDIIGTARPQNSVFDIGAYEYLAESPPALTGNSPRIYIIN